MDKIEQLKKKIEEFQAKSSAKEEIKAFITLVLSILKKAKDNFDSLTAENLQTIKESIAYIESINEKAINSIDDKTNAMVGQFDAKLALLKDLLTKVESIKATPGKDGLDGLNGINPNPEDVVPFVLELLPKPIEETGEKIVDKINSLETDDDDLKIDATHIKNLPKMVQNQIGGVVARNIYQMGDVALTSLANNDTLIWDDTNKLWVNGVGGGTIDGSGVANELTYWVDSNTLGSLATATYPSLIELSYVKGVTSDIQTQINAKGTGTVTSVAMSVPTGLTISGSPVTTTGTLAVSLDTGYVIPLQSTLDAKAPLASPTFTGEVTIPNTGLHLLDSNASHDLIIKPGSNLTADKTLTLTTGDADVILDLTAVTDEYVLAYDTGTNTWRGVASSGGASFGTDNQIPFTNAGGTDFDYSANLTFNGTALALAGNQTISQGTITTDVKALDISSTWNNAAVAFTGIKLNTTQTASASTSLLMDLQRAGTSVFKVGRNGAVTIDPGSGFGSGSGNPVLTLRSFYGTSSFYGDTSSILHLTGSFQVDSTLYLGSGIGFQATGQTVNFNSGNITNLNSISFNGSLGNIKMYHDYNGGAAQASQGIIMRYANRTSGSYPRAAFQVYNNADSTEIPFMVSSQGFAWLRNSKTDEVAYTIKGATSQTANLQNWIDSSDAVLASVSASGNFSTSGYILSALLVEANTAGSGSPNIITSGESKTVFTNEGATALNYHTLPTAVAGLTYTFYVDDADGIRVTANTSDVIQINGVASSAAGYCECTSIGGSVTLTAINAVDWVATSVVGTWTLA